MVWCGVEVETVTSVLMSVTPKGSLMPVQSCMGRQSVQTVLNSALCSCTWTPLFLYPFSFVAFVRFHCCCVCLSAVQLLELQASQVTATDTLARRATVLGGEAAC